jgi:adenosylcobinamide-GDP ribazoletransferase
LSGFRTAITFLTRIPIGDGKKPNVEGAPAWFPVVGLLIGAACGGVFAGGSWLVGPLPGAALAIGFGALVTGAFHQDGLADTADAFGGGWTVEQRLEIFKDSRHGTYGVMSLVIVVALQVTALSTLGMRAGFVALVYAHALGRLGALVVMRHLRPVRPDGLAATLDGLSSYGERFVASALTLLLLIGRAKQSGGLILLGAAALATLAVGWLSKRKLGGYVGDVLGAVEQVVEVAVLVGAAALQRHGRPWLY